LPYVSYEGNRFRNPKGYDMKKEIYEAEIDSLKLQLDYANEHIKKLNVEVDKATTMLLKRTRFRRAVKRVLLFPVKLVKN
jgi:hypothetical protein